jgi:riboflavin synthase
MFSGIVEAMGTIRAASERSGGVRFTVETGIAGELRASESISVCGACLTVVDVSGGAFGVDVVPETVRRTSFGRLAVGSRVNLERPVRLQDRLGGHLVSGHVDGVGEVTERKAEGEGVRMTIRPPRELERYLVYKGSVCVEGVSLTVAAVSTGGFEMALIPYTLEHTTLGELQPGAPVNLEADLVAKYIERLMKEEGRDLFVRREISPEELKRLGAGE